MLFLKWNNKVRLDDWRCPSRAVNAGENVLQVPPGIKLWGQDQLGRGIELKAILDYIRGLFDPFYLHTWKDIDLKFLLLVKY